MAWRWRTRVYCTPRRAMRTKVVRGPVLAELRALESHPVVQKLRRVILRGRLYQAR
jgi:hypothetical protein